jgi:hypothetical protein
VRFKRRTNEAEGLDPNEALPDETAPEIAPHETVAKAPAAVGPRDIAEAADLAAAENVVDLGSLLVPLRDGMDLRLQVDEENGQVMAALVVGEEGLLELRAFAAPRNGDLWGEVRREIAAETAQHGGTASERSGPLGPELYCEVQVQVEDGSTGVQPSRIFGFNGPRWFLRGALLGRPAMEADQAGPWEELFTQIVVRRGDVAMPPGDALPLTLPPEARRLETDA